MELEQLRQLQEVKRCGTISAAAKELLITQPALSRSIKRLEQDLGQELFTRTKSSVKFNEAGELALEHADTILGDVRHMQDDFDEMSRRQRTLKVASVAPAPNWRFTSLVLAKFPTTILKPQISEERDAERSLINREAPFAITLKPLQLPNVLTTQIMTEDLYLYAPSSSPFAKRKSVSFSELDCEPFIVFEQIGFWMEVTRQSLPHSEFIVQSDRNVFTQLVVSSDLLAFTTDVPENTSVALGRKSIPIVDGDAHATFFLSILADAPENVREIFDWVKASVEA